MKAIAEGLFELDADGAIALVGGYSPTSRQYHFPLLDTCFTLAFVPGIVLAAFGNFAIVGPMTLLVLPLNGVLGGVMFVHQRRVFNTAAEGAGTCTRAGLNLFP